MKIVNSGPAMSKRCPKEDDHEHDRIKIKIDIWLNKKNQRDAAKDRF